MATLKVWHLKHCDLFAGLSGAAMDKIAAAADERRITKKQPVLSADADNEHLYIIKKGVVRIFKLSADGKMITLDILKDGDVFGSLSTVGGGVAGAYAQTLEDSYICAIRQEDLAALIKEMPELAISLIGKINQKLKAAEDRIAELVFLGVPGRIANVLLKLAEQFGESGSGGRRISIKLTHQELADMVGASRETVTIVLNGFKEDGLVSISEKHVLLTDEKRLRQWAGKDDA